MNIPVVEKGRPHTGRVLLLINRTAGTGHSPDLIERLANEAVNRLGHAFSFEITAVNSHPEAAQKIRAYLNENREPASVFVGGGGGTLSAVIQGICEESGSAGLPGADKMRIGALRMGSGNVLAKQFGVPEDPVAGLQLLMEGLKQDKIVPCCIGRYEFFRRDGKKEVNYAATLAGLGQFGRVPGDLARWHKNFPRLHKLLASLCGIEHMTNIEYAVCLLIRSIICTIAPGHVERIELLKNGKKSCLGLLAGTVMSFPIKALPFNMDIGIQEEKLLLNIIPWSGRWNALTLAFSPGKARSSAIQVQITREKSVELTLINRDSAEFFLDEDPMVWCGKLIVGIAGSLAFITGK
jgi:hypothetical protein